MKVEKIYIKKYGDANTDHYKDPHYYILHHPTAPAAVWSTDRTEYFVDGLKHNSKEACWMISGRWFRVLSGNRRVWGVQMRNLLIHF